MKKKILLVSMSMLLLALTTACGSTGSKSSQESSAPSGNPGSSTNPDPGSPQVLKIMHIGKINSVEDAGDTLVQQKMPNVTFEYSTLSELQQDITSGNVPDLINVNVAYLSNLKELQLLTDLTPLIKKNKFDMTRFSDAQLNAIKAFSSKGELYALPQGTADSNKYSVFALLYNKDIFDKFAAPYPKDNMTWDEVQQLAKQLNRTSGGIHYHGLMIQNPAENMRLGMGLSFWNSKDQLNFDDPGFALILKTVQANYENEGNWAPWPGLFTTNYMKDLTTAMYAGNTQDLYKNAQQYQSKFNWDLATYPHFQGKDTAPPQGGGIWVIPVTSKNKDLALRYIDIHDSKEVLQSGLAQIENPTFLSKNTKAVKNVPAAPFVDAHQYVTQVRAIWQVAGGKTMLEQHTDINSELFQVKDSVQKKLDSLASK